MIYLFNVLKPDTVVFTDDIYTVELKEPAPDPGSASISRLSAPTSNPAKNRPDIKPIDEEAIWNRLRERLEEEREDMLRTAREEAVSIRADAYREGFEKGIEETKAEIRSFIEKAEKLLAGAEETIRAKLLGYEKSLAQLSAEIASKVLQNKIDEDDRCMTGLIKKTVDEVKNSEWISVRVSSELSQALTGLEEILRQGTAAGKVGISTEEAPKGLCIVETPDCIIDASVWTQLENIKSIL
jgi:flagellar assembly protein FliH